MKPTAVMLKKQHLLPRWFQWWLGVSLAVLVLGTGFWLLTSRPQFAAQWALQQLAQEKELQLQGSLQFSSVNAQPVSTQPAMQGVDFKMSRKGGQEYVEAKLQLQLGSVPVTIPFNMLHHNGDTYYQFTDTSFLKPLINSSAPLEALRLLRIKAVYEAEVGQAWLQAGKGEDIAPFVPVSQTKLQACVGSAFASPASLQEFLYKLAAAPVAIAEEAQNVTKVKVRSSPQALKQLLGSSCQMADTDELTLVFDVSKQKARITYLSIEFTYGFERMILTASVSEAEAPIVQLPESALDDSVLYRIGDETEALLSEQLAQFPDLRTIIENLQHFEAEQGSFNP